MLFDWSGRSKTGSCNDKNAPRSAARPPEEINNQNIAYLDIPEKADIVDLRKAHPRYRTESIGFKLSEHELNWCNRLAIHFCRKRNVMALEAFHLFAAASPEDRECNRQEVLTWQLKQRPQTQPGRNPDMRKVHLKKRNVTAHVKMSEPERDRVKALAFELAIQLNDLLIEALHMWAKASPEQRQSVAQEVKSLADAHSRTYQPPEYDEEDGIDPPI